MVFQQQQQQQPVLIFCYIISVRVFLDKLLEKTFVQECALTED